MATETSITRQAPYIEALGEQYGKDLTALTAKAMPTAGYAPTVAGQDPAQAAAYTQATTARTRNRGLRTLPYSGWSLLRSYGPVLTWRRLISELCLRYQQQVINNNFRPIWIFDVQAQKGMAGIGSLAAKSGNLGGGREGVMRSEYQTQSDLQRAMLQAQMLQQGFGQAQQEDNKHISQQMQMAQAAPQFQGQRHCNFRISGRDPTSANTSYS